MALPADTYRTPGPATMPWRAAGLAALVSVVVNTVLYGLAVAVGVFPVFEFVPTPPSTMALSFIWIVSILGALAGVLLFGLLRRYMREPLRAFLGIAAVVLLVSFAVPFAMPGWSTGVILMLEVMHVVVAAAVVTVVWRMARA